MNEHQKKYIANFRSAWKLRLFFFNRLPSLFFWRAKISQLDTNTCKATVPYSWSSKNPFGSVYFAAQAGVAEISTGVLCQLALQGRGKWAMYVIASQAEYTAVAKGLITFTCTDGAKVESLIQKLEKSGEPGTLEMTSTGTNEEGKIVSTFKILWSFKKKSN